MTSVQGELRLVTDTPDEVSQVWLRAPKERLHGTGMVTTGRDFEPVINGVVSFTALPGPVVMVLLANGIPTSTVKLLVPDKANATLRECIEAVGLADDGALDTLEELALEVARVAAQIASADRLETWASETASAAEQAQISKNEANDAASRAGVHESNAKQSETNSKQSEIDAQYAAERAAENVRGELQGLKDSAEVSASQAKTSETNAATHEANSLSAAERAEFAAEETIQIIEGDYATRNYVDNRAWDKSVVTNADTATTPGAYRATADTVGLPEGAKGVYGSFEVLPAGVNRVTQRFTVTGETQETWERSQFGPTEFYAWKRVIEPIGDPLAAYNAGKGM